jgi:hypothetical protein
MNLAGHVACMQNFTRKYVMEDLTWNIKNSKIDFKEISYTDGYWIHITRIHII